MDLYKVNIFTGLSSLKILNPKLIYLFKISNLFVDSASSKIFKYESKKLISNDMDFYINLMLHYIYEAFHMIYLYNTKSF